MDAPTYWALAERDDGAPISTYGSRSVMIAYNICFMIPLLGMIYLFYRRVRKVRLYNLRHTTYIRALVYASYIMAIAFMLVNISISDHGIHTLRECQTAIYLCIAFLFVGKIITQLFLIERAHVANINYSRRRNDPVWLIAMGVVGTFGPVLSVWTYLNPVAEMLNGQCRKGLPSKVVGPIQAFDIVVNTALTAVFVAMIRRTRKQTLFSLERRGQGHVVAGSMAQRCKTAFTRPFSAFFRGGSGEAVEMERGQARTMTRSDPFTSSSRAPQTVTAELGSSLSNSSSAAASKHNVVELSQTKVHESPSGPRSVGHNMDELCILPPSTRPSKLYRLARRSLIGTLLMFMWSCINSSLFYYNNGHEIAIVCFVQCNADVVLSVCVLHWLTSDPKDDERYAKDTRLSVTRMPSFSESVVEQYPQPTGQMPLTMMLEFQKVAPKRAGSDGVDTV